MTYHSGYPVPPEPMPMPTPPPKRRLKYILIAACVALALLFGGTAYVLFFSGAPPKDVVAEYIGAAQNRDFAAARDLTCDSGDDTIRLQGGTLDLSEQVFHPDAMTWKRRGGDTTGSSATVIVDGRYRGMADGEEDFSLRLDFELRRSMGSWEICGIDRYWVDDWESIVNGDCVSEQGLQFYVSACTNNGVHAIVDEVDEAADCPQPVRGLIETKQRRVLCVGDR